MPNILAAEDNPKRYHKRILPIVFVLGGGFGLLFIVGWIPIWTLWHFNPMEGVGRSANLWHVLWEITRPSTLAELNPAFPVTRNWDARDIIVALIVFSAGAAAGTIGFIIWRRKARLVVEDLIAQSNVGSNCPQYPQYPTPQMK